MKPTVDNKTNDNKTNDKNTNDKNMINPQIGSLKRQIGSLKGQILLFTAVTLIITYASWIAFYLLHASKGGIVFDDSPFGLLMLLGLFAPTLTALVLSHTLGKSTVDGTQKMSRQTQWQYLPITIALVSAYVLSDYAASNALGSLFDPSQEKGLWQVPTMGSILSAFAMSILFGGLEELGWRGYLLPRFLKLWSPLKATVILSGIWTLWHVPLFFIPGTAQASYNFVVFALSTFTLSAIMSWLWLKTQSTTVAVLAHTTFNAFAVLGYTSGTSMEQVAVSAIFAAISIVFLQRHA